MTKNISHVKNPLTVISIFAGIAEISGTVVLPFVSPEHQGTFIWFLMLFPTLLVIAFFLTLNLNHKTLYAPSDYQNQNHFMNLFGIVTPDERETKLNEEVLEATPAEAPLPADVEPQTGEHVNKSDTGPLEPYKDTNLPEEIPPPLDSIPDTPSTSQTTPSLPTDGDTPLTNFDLEEFANNSKKDLKIRLRTIEKRSIQKLREATGIPFSQNVKMDIPGLAHPLIFDAVAHQNETLHIAEVKFFDHTSFSLDRFNGTLSNANIAAQSIQKLSNRKLTLHLVVAVNYEISKSVAHNIKVLLSNTAKKLGIHAKVYVISQDALFRNGIPASWIFAMPDERYP